MATLIASHHTHTTCSIGEPVFSNSLNPLLRQRFVEPFRPYALSRDQIEAYARDGYLVVRDLLTPEETENIILWTNQVKSWDGKTSEPYLQYDENTEEGSVRCSSENFVSVHQGFAKLLGKGHLPNTISDLYAGENVYLFKEKINYKVAKAGGYAPHIDASAYEHLKSLKHKIHTTLLIAVEEATVENGCLEVVPGSHIDGRINPIPTVGGKTITDEWTATHKWKGVPLKPGEALIFDSYLAHRSGPNHTDSGRACLYATYTTQLEGEEVHKDYYEHRCKYWPATANRNPKQDYSEGANIYAWATPMTAAE
ncbi:hypothetical protein Clacol_000778 [Clathrus columnatus]|uniref:Phytanoyl-CoA dioxygenase n=1 Tax=Clathrus columnatus TaxID=1419009 RepID=A0AAV4ZXR1_9AGAM|nr:hypothetical protein Clacol_000778 [Clathrus columnatus]